MSLAPLVVGISVWLIWPAHALGRALVRFVHGVPGVGRATVLVGDGRRDRDLGAVSFAQATRWHSIRSGRFRWTLRHGGRTLASGTATLDRGAYDVLVLEQGTKVRLGAFPASAGHGGHGLLRVLHGAPELGSPALSVDGSVVVKRLAYLHGTPYLPVPAGVHTLGAGLPGTSTSPVPGGRVRIVAGRSYSAVVLGTRGQRVRVVTLVDRGAPLTRPATTVAYETPKVLTVHAGDSLWSIARRLSGPRADDAAIAHRLVAIWNANERRIGTGDPNLIFPGTRLQV